MTGSSFVPYGSWYCSQNASFLSYRTSQYKLHYYETPTNIKFVMLTDTKSGSMRIALQQIYVNCYVEYVVKNPLSPAEHPGGIGVNNELFEASLEQFVVCGSRNTGIDHQLANRVPWDRIVCLMQPNHAVMAIPQSIALIKESTTPQGISWSRNCELSLGATR